MKQFYLLVPAFVFLVVSCKISIEEEQGRKIETHIQNALHVVVMGSSTAAGAGPSKRDSAWAFRLKKYMKRINPRNKVTLLARGGYVSYRFLPHGFVDPNERWTIDSSRNITHALSLKPDAIILNLPSNDNTLRIPVETQMQNLRKIVAVADSAHVPIWISTTQPVDKARMRRPQQIVRDSIRSSFAPYVLDFWTKLASADAKIDTFYAKGDGVHLNRFGHDILYKRVLEKINIDSLYQAKQIRE